MSYYDENGLERFKAVSLWSYKEAALEEIRTGRKKSHWMWFVFPQLVELGQSQISKKYGIRGKAEALGYINDEFLRDDLITISKVLLELNTNNPTEVLGSPDDLKLKSCMTLFSEVAPELKGFQQVLDKFYGGKKDGKTIELLKRKCTLDEIFLIEPRQWGLRGDPVLWDKMRDSFKNEEIPETSAELRQKLYQKYYELTGKELNASDKEFYSEAFSKGGMSTGYITPSWWVNEGIPLLLESAQKLKK